MTDQIKQVIMIEGCDEQFESKADALNYLRRPKIRAALMKVTDNQKDLSEWLIDNQETVIGAFDTGTVRRVTKSEKKKLDKAVDALVAVEDPAIKKACAFLIEHSEAMKDSFRWPKVKRMTDEEKKVAAKNTLMAASEGNEKLADWTIENETAILEAYDAGKEKRAVSPKAASGLAAYRAGKAEEKRLIEEENMDPAEAKAKGEELMASLKAEAAAA